MSWQFSDDRPIYLQLVERLQFMIITGVYSPGEKIQSVRELAEIAAVNPNTMQKALAYLEQTGLIFSVRTSGRFITEDKELIKQVKDLYVKNIAGEFLEKMKNYNYSVSDIIELIKAVDKEENE